MTYRLYGSPASRAARVMWALEEIGAPYEIVPAKGGSAEVRAINPAGKIPVLVDGDFVLADSIAILLHLADRHGTMTFPAGSKERAEMTAKLLFAADEIEGPLWTLTKHRFTLPEAMRAEEAIRPACHAEFSKAMETLAVLIGEGPFLMGGTFTVADILVGHLGGWAKAMGFPEPPATVAAYMERVRSRPGWQAVAKARAAAA